MLRTLMLPCLCLLLLAVAGLVAAQEATLEGPWPQFRGPLRNGVSPATGLLKEWPAAGPPLAWQTAGAGTGYASVAIAGGRLYTLGDAPSTAPDDDEYVSCFDNAAGKLVWQTKVGPPWTSGQPDWQTARSTPTVDRDLLYVLTPHGRLVCLSVADGQEVWSKDLKEDFGGVKAEQWGYSESVLVDGDRVVCTPGGPQATLVALDKRSGELLWKSVWPEDRGAGHASIVISQVAGTRIYVQLTGGGALGVRADNGQLLWTFPIDRTIAVIPTPIVRDALVFFTAGYGRGGALLRQVPAAGGKINVQTVYPLNNDLANKHGGVVLVGDYLYGDSDDRGTPWCAELMTGQIRWKERGSGRGSAAVTAADGRLYFRFANGQMVLADATPEAYREISSFKIPGSGERPSWSYPVVIEGRLYLREQDRILVYDVHAGN